MQPVSVSLATIPSPDRGVIELGPLDLHAYGLMLAVGILVATFVADRRFTNRGGEPRQVVDIALWVVVGGVVGARVYHLFTGYDWDSGGIAGTFAIWEGGLSIWGAVMGGAAALVIVARSRHLDSLALTDSVVVGLVLAQAIGRWGNYFNQELFGRPTDLPWGLEIDLPHRPPEYLQFETFHPTFLYESLYLLLMVGMLLWAERAFRFKRGQTTALYIALYTFGRFFFENMRSDPATEIGPLRVNAWVSIVLFVGAVVWFVWLGRRPDGTYPVAPWTTPVESVTSRAVPSDDSSE